MSNSERENSFNNEEREEEDLNEYYESEENELSNRIPRNEGKDNQQKVKYYNDQPYDLAYDINESVEEGEEEEIKNIGANKNKQTLGEGGKINSKKIILFNKIY